MLKIFKTLCLGGLLAALPIVAGAQVYNGPSAPLWKTCLISSTTAVVCKSSAAHIVGAVNNSLTAQTVTVSCYDNATAASGTVAWNIGALGISQQIAYPLPGRPTTTGLTCAASGATTGGNVEIQYW